MGVLGPTLVCVAAVLAFVYFKTSSHSPNLSVDTIAEEYDYIVIGGGTAGSVVAARLAEDKDHTILLLEAGGMLDDIPSFKMPFLWATNTHTKADWEYFTEPQAGASLGLKNGRDYWPRGKVLGGSGILNAMQYTRGSPLEYDQWAENGCTGWSYKDVLPYFLKSEDILIPELKSSKYHNSGGPIGVSSGAITELGDFYLKAGAELGYDITDYNGEDQRGVSIAQLTVRNGVRSSTGLEFLVKGGKRENLDIAVESMATRIHIQDKKAEGVFFIRNRRKQYVKARKEVVVSAGAINSPQLLMLSGIGPKEHLQDLNIPLVADLPVGQNLQDHAMVPFGTQISKPYSLTYDMFFSVRSFLQYFLFGSGPWTTSGIEGALFVHLDETTKGKSPPDLHAVLYSIYLADTIYNIDDEIAKETLPNSPNEYGFVMAINLNHPRSRGTIALKSTDPFDYPVINSGYLTERKDLDTFIAGIRFCERFLQTKTMKMLGADLNSMNHSICSKHDFRSDSYWECFVRHFTLTNYHHSSTCKMGPDDDQSAVVDPRLRVRGVQNLRVVDASIFPNVTSGNINAPVVMVAEKAADMIRGKNTVKHLIRNL